MTKGEERLLPITIILFPATAAYGTRRCHVGTHPFIGDWKKMFLRKKWAAPQRQPPCGPTRLPRCGNNHYDTDGCRQLLRGLTKTNKQWNSIQASLVGKTMNAFYIKLLGRLSKGRCIRAKGARPHCFASANNTPHLGIVTGFGCNGSVVRNHANASLRSS